jgi:putative Holliday junction resolvase
VTRRKALGIDPGERRIGVAVSDDSGLIASPHSVIDRRREDPAARIAALCDELDVATVVVGLPVTLAGAEGASAAAARGLGAEIAVASGRNLVYWDERFTSVQAEQSLLEAGVSRRRRRELTDKVAAAMMLQGYLDHGPTEDE